MSPTDPHSRRSGARAGGSSPPDPRHVLGRLGEQIAAAHLERRGFAIVERNFRTRHGEIDLIARGSGVLAFVEVKTRRMRTPTASAVRIEPLEGLSPLQRARLRGMAAAWLRDRRPRLRSDELRFDAIGVLLDRRDRLLRLDHIEGAW